jgi:hypothetical protein
MVILSKVLISEFRGQTLDSITRYEGYSIDTSFEGVERTVRRLGMAAVVTFDQGANYTLRTQPDRSIVNTDYHWPDFPVHFIMDAAYSYYVDCGGELTIGGLLTMNELINNLQLIDDKELIPGRLAWTPQYVRKEERPVTS